MRKTNLLRLLLTATVALVAGSFIAILVRAAVGDIWETNNAMILKFTRPGGTPGTFSPDCPTRRASSLMATDMSLCVGGNGPVGATVVVRAIGLSLSAFGITDALQDPVLELHDSSGTLIASNDNYKDAPTSQRVGTSLAPTDDRESALQVVLHGGAYTAIVSGAGGTTGTAVVEVYNLQ